MLEVRLLGGLSAVVDGRPVELPADAQDVATAVRFATDHGLALAVRGGGHNVAGTAVVDDGLVVDLSAMRGVHMDASGRSVHVQGGATWADVDGVTAPLGLAAPGGVVSDTGVAGLALSGGVSHQRRRDGMTVDNLLSADVVLADGRQVRASADEHADLYWALRGGGGNFGVVTSFELRVHELGPEVFAVNVAYSIDDAARVLAGWRDAVAGAPDELSTAGFIWTLPVADELPELLRGLPYVGVAGMWAGDPAEGERATRALREAYAGWLTWDWTLAERVLRAWAAWTATAPETATTTARILQLPPLPELPEPLRGRRLVVIDGALTGDAAAAAALLAPLRALGPEIDTCATVPAPALVRLHGDPEEPVPWTSATTMLRELPDEAIATLVATAGPGSGSALLVAELRHLGGALGRRAPGAGAVSGFDAAYLLYTGGMAPIPEAGAVVREQARALVDALGPWAGGRAYLSFAESTTDPATAFDAAGYARLRAVRARVDPDGLFRANHEVPPAG